MKTTLGSPALRAVLDGLHERQASLEQDWEGLFVPPEGERAIRERAVIIHRTRTALDGLASSCEDMLTKAQAAFAHPNLQAEIAGLLRFFEAKRDEITTRMRQQ